MIRLLTFTTLFPNSVTPNHAVFVETRLRHLLASGRVESRVIAPVPWFPSKNPIFGAYASFARVPPRESRDGIKVEHPRFVRLPKVGMSLAPRAMAASSLAVARRLLECGYQFDLIDAHYFFPDGVAAMILGAALGKPVVITARGTDISVIPRHSLPRRMILRAARECAAIVTVCAALRDELVSLGADPRKITVLRNGVDLDQFHPGDRAEARAAYAMDGFTLVSVGRLIPLKGHHLIIESLATMPDVRLMIAGAGPEERRLRAWAEQYGVADRVRFLGTLSQRRLRVLYAGADALVLASSSEGWANVLLESMACGTPAIASNVWGIPEVVTAPAAGVLMSERSARGVAEAVRQLRAALPSREETRRYAEQFSWEETTLGQLRLFESILSPRRHEGTAG